MVRIPSAELSGAGTKEVVPPVQITIGVSALLETLAFDEGSGLWTSFSVGKFVRLAPAQRTVSTSAGDLTAVLVAPVARWAVAPWFAVGPFLPSATSGCSARTRRRS